MAIPPWLWPDEHAREEGLTAAEVERASDVFEVLSSPIRVEILAALHGRSEPLSYTALRAETSVADKGRFNYHLRRLDSLVRRRDGEYALTDRGEALVGHVLDEERVLGGE